MKKAKLIFKRSLIVISIMTIVGVAALFFYFVSNDAPILKGEVLYHISYKKGKTLDVYQPTNQVYEKTPVVVFFHGGAWIMGRKEAININRFNTAINTLRKKGYAVISPEYALATKNQSPFPNCIIDALDAFRWVEENAEKYDFDLQNVGVFGESAGAHIAMMSVFGKEEGTIPSGIKINYLVDVYGPTDLQALYQMPVMDSISSLLSKMPDRIGNNLDITQYLFGFDPKTDSARTAAFTSRFSPINHLDRNDPPVLMIHGNQDRLVPLSQSMILKEKLKSSRIEHEFHILDNVDHAFINATKDQKSDVQQWIIDFIIGHYNKTED